MKKHLSIFAVAMCAAFVCAAENTQQPARVFDFDEVCAERGGNSFEAMKSLLGAVQAMNGAPAKITFSKKEYTFPHCPTDFTLINATSISNLEIDGGGATLKIHAANSFLRLAGCRNVAVKNFAIIYTPSPFTQGAISRANPAAGTFEFAVDEGYPTLSDDAAVKARYGEKGWEWGSVMDGKDPRQRKRDVSDHYFIDKVEPLGGNKFKITVEKSYAAGLKGVADGDVFAMPVRNFKDNAKDSFTPNVAISGSADVTVENISLYRNRNSMCFWICGNTGKVTMRGNKITWLAGSKDAIASWRDGYHCKSNEVGPTIENCRCEGLLDDSINISTDTVMISKIIDSKTFELTRGGFRVGDEIGLLFMDTGMWVEGLKIVSKKGAVVELDKSVDGVKTGLKRPHIDKDSTQVYNLKNVNKNFKIKNCFFGKQRRNAMLVRAFGGEIDGNVIDEVTANGAHLSNETGWFYEGPFPRDISIKNNTFKNTWSPAVTVMSHTFSGKPLNVDCNVKIFKNTFVKDSDKKYPPAIYISAMRGVTVRDNVFRNSAGKAIATENAIRVNNSENITIEQAK